MRLLVGTAVPDGATPVAQAYAGHQFGGYSPRLGDGRALLLGELVDADGRLRDLHLKGSGRTPFARGGDGLAAVGPMLREYVVSEAMHALGIPTTRSLAVVATGRPVRRETLLPGRRAGPGREQPPAGRQLPVRPRPPATSTCCAGSPTTRSPATTPAPRTPSSRYLALFEAVVAAQASLVARWMLVGFVHGVMNTDNMTISGETIDYGPCAFMDAYDPATVFSSIDHGGRYAYGNQPLVAEWNLARLAEALLPLLADDQEQAVALAVEALGGSGRSTTPPGRPACGPSSACRPALDDAVAAAGRRPARPAAGRATSTTRRSSARLGDGRPRRRRAGARRCSSTSPAFDAWLRALARPGPGRRRDGPGQPGLHPAQPPRRGGARRRDRRRPGPARAAAGRGDRARSTSGPASSATPHPRRRTSARYRTFCGT